MSLPESQSAAKSTRCWYQFSLRTLLIFVTLCAIACSWLAVKMRQARKQRDVVAAIDELGGTIRYDDWFGPSDTSGPLRSPVPGWLCDALGDDFFRTAFAVDFSGNAIGNENLACLADLPHLRSLRVSSTFVTDEGLIHIGNLLALRDLDLSVLEITDAGLKHLRRLTQLKTLDLAWTQVTEMGVKELQQALPKCEIFWEPRAKNKRPSPAESDQLR